MSVWCLCVEFGCVLACLICAALSPRADSQGYVCCELHATTKRLNKITGKKHKHGVGHICQDCYDKLRGKRKAASASSSSRSSSDGVAPPPKKKRRTASDPGNQSDSDTVITTRTTGAPSTQAQEE
jgi:hypothetical protein